MTNNKEKNFLSTVLYICNDEDYIEEFLINLISVLEVNFENYEIICVNDASSDNSASLIHKIAENNVSGIVTIINMSYHQGLELCMNAGVDLAIGDFVFEFDSVVMNYDPEIIMKIYYRSLEGYDIVAASDNKHQFSSTIFYSLFNRNANLQYKLQTETFRVLSRRAINRVHSMGKKVPYRKAFYANCGLKMDTINYIPEKDLPIKKSTTNYRYMLAFDSIILFTKLANKIAIILSIVMMLATLAEGIYTLVIYLLGKPVAGFTTTMLVITSAFFGVFAILTIIIKYLSVIVDLVFNEKKYMFESIEKISSAKYD